MLMVLCEAVSPCVHDAIVHFMLSFIRADMHVMSIIVLHGQIISKILVESAFMPLLGDLPIGLARPHPCLMSGSPIFNPFPCQVMLELLNRMWVGLEPDDACSGVA